MFAAIVDEDCSSDIARMASVLRGGTAPIRTVCDERGRAAFAGGPTGILVEDAHDLQPYAAEDLVFVAQARIDNRDDVLASLDVPAADRPRVADADVAHRAYRRWGIGCTQRLYGDFAFCAWHRDSGRLAAAVDHKGFTRLYYARTRSGLVLSPQLRAVLAHARVPHELDLEMLGLLAAPHVLVGSTPFAQVRHLVGGHQLVFERGELRIEKWWNPDPTVRVYYRDPRDYAAHATEVFDRAVAACLRAAAPVGSTMSGGLDSTLVAATAARILDARGQRLTAYTSVPEPGLACSQRRDVDDDDWPFAAQVAARYANMTHVAVRPDGACPLDIMPRIHERSCGPVRNTQNHVWLARMCELTAAAGARVLLLGQWGNATLSHWGDEVLGDLARAGAWRTAAGEMWKLARRGANPLRSIVASELRPWRSRAAGFPGAPFLERGFRRAHARTMADAIATMSRIGWVDFATKPMPAVAMDAVPQWGIELRDPTADRALIETVMSFPRQVFLLDGRRRGLARAMGRGLVPDAIRFRTRRGAQMPEGASIIAAHGDRYRQTFERVRSLDGFRAIYDVNAVAHVVDHVCRGRGTALEGHCVDRALDIGQFMQAARHFA